MNNGGDSTNNTSGLWHSRGPNLTAEKQKEK
jgi:hypothetical protein